MSHLSVAFEPSYPEGNFEWNQLLGGSIGLSPLCHSQATRFARQNSDRPPPQFPMASSSNGIVHHLSGPMGSCKHSKPCPLDFGPGRIHAYQRRVVTPSQSGSLLTEQRCRLHFALRSGTHQLETNCAPCDLRKPHRLLGPCSKTGRGQH